MLLPHCLEVLGRDRSVPAVPSTGDRYFGFAGLRKVMVRAHRQAWCWQDEWYGLTIEDIRQLEKEAQLMLAQKMAQFCSENDAEQHGVKEASGEKDAEANTVSPADTEDAAGNSETASGRSLTKQWSTSSKSSRSSKRGGKMLMMTAQRLGFGR